MATEVGKTFSSAERKYRVSEKAWEAERPIEEAMMFSVLINEINEFELFLDEEAITMGFATQKGNDAGERLGDSGAHRRWIGDTGRTPKLGALQ